MNTAQSIIEQTKGAAAVTYYGGYAQFSNKPRITFEPAHIEQERRNQAGRCTYLLVRYKDGSAIEFKWSEQHGAKIKALQS